MTGATVKKRKSSVKHKPAGGIAMPAGWANKAKQCCLHLANIDFVYEVVSSKINNTFAV